MYFVWMDHAKGKQGYIQLKCILGKLCIDKPVIQMCCYFDPQCNVIVIHIQSVYLNAYVAN